MVDRTTKKNQALGTNATTAAAGNDQTSGHNVKVTKEREIELIALAKQGHQAATRELIELHQQRLFAFIWRIVRSNDEAEDICQETFMRAVTSLKDFNEEFRFSTWIFTIGYRLALNSIKHRSLQRNMDFSNVARAGQKNQVDEIIQSEHADKVREVIWREVEDLSPAQKATILMFYRQGLSCQEIGEVLDMPVATVKSHMHRAREKLRERLRLQRIDGNDLQAVS
jgi:RNA polymerase sigma-70 factor, ECF subfamily